MLEDFIREVQVQTIGEVVGQTIEEVMDQTIEEVVLGQIIKEVVEEESTTAVTIDLLFHNCMIMHIRIIQKREMIRI